ncbi:MAG TPA: lipase family protein [Gammaproteobacteria bacterium]|nr:lipase family protein [Gammaproteobacteria bacterium]
MRIHARTRWISLCLCALSASGCALLEQAVGGGSPPPVAAQPAVVNPLACKLLKASAYAYRVNSTGAIAPDSALAGLLGESGEAYGVASGGAKQTDSDRDAAYLWLSSDEVIVAFRGTLPYNSGAGDPETQALVLQDWLNDTDFAPQADPELGQVHKGFRDSFYNLWPGIQGQIKAWQAAGRLGPDVKVYVTGHSKGGALAMLAALKLRADQLLPVTEVDTFGAPRVGGADFAARYSAQGINGLRYENQDDMVPHVPLDQQELSLLPLLQRVITISGNPSGDYVSVGRLRYITTDGGIASPPDAAAEAELDTQRLTEFGTVLVQAPADVMNTVIAAHVLGDLTPGDKSRYFQAVCEAGTVP